MAVYFGQIITSSGGQFNKHSKNVCKYHINHGHTHSNSQTVLYFTKIMGILRQVNNHSKSNHDHGLSSKKTGVHSCQIMLSFVMQSKMVTRQPFCYDLNYMYKVITQIQQLLCYKNSCWNPIGRHELPVACHLSICDCTYPR